MLPRDNLDFQKLRNTILGHSGKTFVQLQTHYLEFKVTIIVITLQCNGEPIFISELCLLVGVNLYSSVSELMIFTHNMLSGGPRSCFPGKI